ncbi:winged helix-turn-helix domain-containing protein [Streptomyces griseoloalbus]|uniref:winged helix-turn-helix domain-containing protein n=1 Tax=Streptomyces griseoloalbus TaxID=67303 RepID=UPI0033B7EF1D
MLRTPVDGTRLRILTWLREPGTAETGLTADDVATRLGVPRPVALTHLRLLTALGVLRADHCAGPPVYRRDEARIAEVTEVFEKGW